MSGGNEYQKILDEIEKVKFHNRSLLTLIGIINEDKMEKTTIYETTVMFDLSKKDLRELKILIESYSGNNFAFEQKALKINPTFKKNNLIFILKSFLNTGMFEDKITSILESYES
ncbi:hypothetical protein KM914_14960 [Virgibacillus pantothenticus]|uniref:Uncharacterized protein n=1 Tax=Virgibacillus pantothenticus TaxID=1473 RepID=A0A0L0QL02_VIRPA|nr:hypothetical protein [Virgibacillus pantothenticus]KNE19241.1 hypothetical protein AFK71_11980 [Virgibacillus pantothenticus]MBU8567705.1 hypothetical protein [Virgibacillus pantothenticus]MBU8602092.1 hypothetical protein [Virgibacillus pantothenticus]MBU8635729.1 hypothetical protein [Virgibacillus pantothenticus]MBU8643939.1 hypothetical protein [Virgibacillus pantothenticus]